jgi:hypothetical protein
MENVEIKKKIFDALKTIVAMYPDLRFCQLMSNLTKNSDDYYLTDDDYLKHLQSVIKNGFPIE